MIKSTRPELNPNIMIKLDKITSKGVTSMTEADKIWLRARRSYLNPTQLETYAEVLGNVIDDKTTSNGGSNSPSTSVTPGVKPPGEPSYKDLQKEASSYGMKNTVAKSRAKLIKFINQAKKVKGE